MIEVLEFGNKFAVNAFDIYVIVRLLKAIFKDKVYDKRFLHAAIAIDMIITLLVNYYGFYVWSNIITSVLLAFMLVCCYEGSIGKKIGVTVGINILFALSELIIALLMGIENLSVLAKASNGESVALFLSRIIFWIIVIIVQKIVAKDNPNKLSVKVVALEVIVFLTMICELLFLCIRKQESIIIESAVLFASEITVYLMIYLQDCLVELFASKEQARLIEQEKEYYQKEAVIIQQKQELQRQFRHDLKNRLQILNEIAERGNISELKKYLSEVEEKHKEYEAFSNTGNLIIDSIINSKLEDAIEMGIEVNAGIMLPASIEVNSDDMVVILGNLLDNAIEACERVNASKYIKLLINYEEGCLILSIKNSFDQIINKAGGKFLTRKEDKALHGLGIKSVKNTVEKYNGIIDFTSEGKEFAVNIILYL